LAALEKDYEEVGIDSVEGEGGEDEGEYWTGDDIWLQSNLWKNVCTHHSNFQNDDCFVRSAPFESQNKYLTLNLCQIFSFAFLVKKW
jgi:hypothetical protein